MPRKRIYKRKRRSVRRMRRIPNTVQSSNVRAVKIIYAHSFDRNKNQIVDNTVPWLNGVAYTSWQLANEGFYATRLDVAYLMSIAGNDFTALKSLYNRFTITGMTIKYIPNQWYGTRNDMTGPVVVSYNNALASTNAANAYPTDLSSSLQIQNAFLIPPQAVSGSKFYNVAPTSGEQFKDINATIGFGTQAGGNLFGFIDISSSAVAITGAGNDLAVFNQGEFIIEFYCAFVLRQ